MGIQHSEQNRTPRIMRYAMHQQPDLGESSPEPLLILLHSWTPQLHPHNPLPSHASNLRPQLPALIQRSRLVTPADTFPVDKDIRHGLAPRVLGQERLQLRAKLVLVELDDVGLWVDKIFLEEDAFGAGGVGAVGFGEYYYWGCCVSDVTYRGRAGCE